MITMTESNIRCWVKTMIHRAFSMKLTIGQNSRREATDSSHVFVKNAFIIQMNSRI